MSKRPNRKSLPKAPVAAQIESFAHDLRGVAHVDGKAVFVDGALPGEEVEFIYTDIHRDYAEARIDRVITPAPERIKANCPHFGVCGGCLLYTSDAADE